MRTDVAMILVALVMSLMVVQVAAQSLGILNMDMFNAARSNIEKLNR